MILTPGWLHERRYRQDMFEKISTFRPAKQCCLTRYFNIYLMLIGFFHESKYNGLYTDPIALAHFETLLENFKVFFEQAINEPTPNTDILDEINHLMMAFLKLGE